MYNFNNDMNLRERICGYFVNFYPDTMIMLMKEGIVLLFSILILGQNVVSYNVQNEFTFS